MGGEADYRQVDGAVVPGELGRQVEQRLAHQLDACRGGVATGGGHAARGVDEQGDVVVLAGQQAGLRAAAVAEQDVVAGAARQLVVAVRVIGNRQLALGEGETLGFGGVRIGQTAVVADAKGEARLAIGAGQVVQAPGGDVGEIDGLAGTDRLAIQQQAAAGGQAVDEQL